MSFLEFLTESLDFQGRTSRFAKVVLLDIDNGCGSSRFNATAWKVHFIEKHGEYAPQLVDMLLLAYVEYANTSKSK